jgi:hypothetical protein
MLLIDFGTKIVDPGLDTHVVKVDIHHGQLLRCRSEDIRYLKSVMDMHI